MAAPLPTDVEAYRETLGKLTKLHREHVHSAKASTELVVAGYLPAARAPYLKETMSARRELDALGASLPPHLRLSVSVPTQQQLASAAAAAPVRPPPLSGKAAVDQVTQQQSAQPAQGRRGRAGPATRGAGRGGAGGSAGPQPLQREAGQKRGRGGKGGSSGGGAAKKQRTGETGAGGGGAGGGGGAALVSFDDVLAAFKLDDVVVLPSRPAEPGAARERSRDEASREVGIGHVRKTLAARADRALGRLGVGERAAECLLRGATEFVAGIAERAVRAAKRRRGLLPGETQPGAGEGAAKRRVTWSPTAVLERIRHTEEAAAANTREAERLFLLDLAKTIPKRARDSELTQQQRKARAAEAEEQKRLEDAATNSAALSGFGAGLGGGIFGGNGRARRGGSGGPGGVRTGRDRGFGGPKTVTAVDVLRVLAEMRGAECVEKALLNGYALHLAKRDGETGAGAGAGTVAGSPSPEAGSPSPPP